MGDFAMPVIDYSMSQLSLRYDNISDSRQPFGPGMMPLTLMQEESIPSVSPGISSRLVHGRIICSASATTAYYSVEISLEDLVEMQQLNMEKLEQLTGLLAQLKDVNTERVEQRKPRSVNSQQIFGTLQEEVQYWRNMADDAEVRRIADVAVEKKKAQRLQDELVQTRSEHEHHLKKMEEIHKVELNGSDLANLKNEIARAKASELAMRKAMEDAELKLKLAEDKKLEVQETQVYRTIEHNRQKEEVERRLAESERNSASLKKDLVASNEERKRTEDEKEAIKVDMCGLRERMLDLEKLNAKLERNRHELESQLNGNVAENIRLTDQLEGLQKTATSLETELTKAYQNIEDQKTDKAAARMLEETQRKLNRLQAEFRELESKAGTCSKCTAATSSATSSGLFSWNRAKPSAASSSAVIVVLSISDTNAQASVFHANAVRSTFNYPDANAQAALGLLLDKCRKRPGFPSGISDVVLDRLKASCQNALKSMCNGGTAVIDVPKAGGGSERMTFTPDEVASTMKTLFVGAKNCVDDALSLVDEAPGGSPLGPVTTIVMAGEVTRIPAFVAFLKKEYKLDDHSVALGAEETRAVSAAEVAARSVTGAVRTHS